MEHAGYSFEHGCYGNFSETTPAGHHSVISLLMMGIWGRRFTGQIGTKDSWNFALYVSFDRIVVDVLVCFVGIQWNQR